MARWQAHRRLSIEFVPVLLRALLFELLRVHPTEHAGEYYASYLRAFWRTLRRRRISMPNELLRREVIVAFRGNRYCVTSSTVFGYYLLPFEPATARHLFQASGNLFLDVGANVGQYTVPLARRFRSVVAVEPNPEAARLLRRNLALNGITNVRVIESAVAPTSGRIRLFRGEFLSTWSITPTSGGFVEVEAVTLPALLGSTGPVDLLKIDIEGAEVKVLLGSLPALAVVGELNFETDLDRDVTELFRSLEGVGFRVSILGGWWRDRENIQAVRTRAG